MMKARSDKTPVIMGILNLTPDSFSDGDPEANLDFFFKKAEQLIRDGCHILDVGGESTRPDAQSISEKQECERVIPFLKLFRQKYPDFPVSLDTKKFAVATQGMRYGIQILNDVSCLQDERFVDLVKQHHCDYVLMHSRGDSKTMMQLTEYPLGVVEQIKQELQEKIERLIALNFPREHLILDLGFGFAKTPDQCVTLINQLVEWQDCPYRLLFGVSRKRFIQNYTGENTPVERDAYSAELAQQAIKNNFTYIRTHNVALTKQYLTQ